MIIIDGKQIEEIAEALSPCPVCDSKAERHEFVNSIQYVCCNLECDYWVIVVRDELSI